jgi:hypothetical protein
MMSVPLIDVYMWGQYAGIISGHIPGGALLIYMRKGGQIRRGQFSALFVQPIISQSPNYASSTDQITADPRRWWYNRQQPATASRQPATAVKWCSITNESCNMSVHQAQQTNCLCH